MNSTLAKIAKRFVRTVTLASVLVVKAIPHPSPKRDRRTHNVIAKDKPKPDVVKKIATTRN